MMDFFTRNSLWILPLLGMAVIAPFTPAWDLAISHYFYDQHHTFSSNAFYTFMFDYGPIPAHAVCAIAVLTLIFSFFSNRCRNWRRPALVLVLTMALGAGLISHAILKDHWGRPRPKLTTEFGGQQPFRPFYEPNFFEQPEPSEIISLRTLHHGILLLCPGASGTQARQTKPLLGVSAAGIRMGYPSVPYPHCPGGAFFLRHRGSGAYHVAKRLWMR